MYRDAVRKMATLVNLTPDVPIHSEAMPLMLVLSSLNAPVRCFTRSRSRSLANSRRSPPCVGRIWRRDDAGAGAGDGFLEDVERAGGERVTEEGRGGTPRTAGCCSEVAVRPARMFSMLNLPPLPVLPEEVVEEVEARRVRSRGASS